MTNGRSCLSGILFSKNQTNDHKLLKAFFLFEQLHLAFPLSFENLVSSVPSKFGDFSPANNHRQNTYLFIYPYVVDFACLSQKIIIECDGSQHLEQQE